MSIQFLYLHKIEKVDSRKKITGIILSGGKSSRMGKEKGLCTLNGKPLIEYAVEVLLEVCDEVIISANSDEYEYLGLPMVQDVVIGVGPVGGLISALQFSKTEDNFVLSCDMPFVSKELVRYILSEKEEYQAVMPVNNGFVEPLCAYYRKDVAKIFAIAIDQGIYKIQRIIREADVNFINIDTRKGFDSKLLFSNINTVEELKRFEEE